MHRRHRWPRGPTGSRRSCRCRRRRGGVGVVGGDLFGRHGQVERDRHVRHGRAYGRNAVGNGREGRVVRLDDGHADLRQRRHDATTGRLHLARELMVETVRVGGHDISRRTGAAGITEHTERHHDGAGNLLHGIPPSVVGSTVSPVPDHARSLNGRLRPTSPAAGVPCDCQITLRPESRDATRLAFRLDRTTPTSAVSSMLRRRTVPRERAVRRESPTAPSGTAAARHRNRRST